MPFAQVILNSIEIHNTDEDNSEWHFNVGANTWNSSLNFDWNVDGVSDGDFYNFSQNGMPVSQIFMVNPGEQIFIHAGGYEEDDPGFPLYDDNDGLPGFRFSVDPAAVSAGNGFSSVCISRRF